MIYLNNWRETSWFVKAGRNEEEAFRPGQHPLLTLTG